MQSYRLGALMLAALTPITLGSSYAQAENFSVLYSFTGTPDGATPYAAPINIGGTLYGTTLEGGVNNHGSVFAITPAGVETVIYSFEGGADGAGPVASLINVGGVLYGTTGGGGDGGCGTVFKVTPTGVETVLYAFGTTPNDGCGPPGGLIDVGGTLYGTTEDGGSHNFGTVFKVTLAGVETVLHSFGFGADGDGIYPKAGLIKVGHTLYGTTFQGGMDHVGTVFKISPDGAESLLYAFKTGADAQFPEAPLVNIGGTLYGTAPFGGENSCEKQTESCGAVFAVTLKGHEKVLYSFQGKPDGTLPEAGLINVNGVLYGTTAWGGDGRNCDGHGCGTIFKLTTAGVETVVHSFSLDEGIYPNTSLLKLGHFLYGTAPGFGASGDGTVFALEHR